MWGSSGSIGPARSPEEPALHAASRARSPCPALPCPHSVKNTLSDTAVSSKLDAGDRERLEKAVKDTIDWIDHNQVRGRVRDTIRWINHSQVRAC